MNPPKSLTRCLGLLALCFGAVAGAKAAPLTFTGTFTNDSTVQDFSFTSSSSQNFTFYTTSYGGGMNADGTRSLAGGFVPVVTLFTASGNVLGFGGGDGMCHGSAAADATTHLCEDANFSQLLGPGNYIAALSEFPNVALGNLSDGFLAGSDAHFTGTNCGTPSGTFLQADLAPCVQRNANFSLNITSPTMSAVPEPPTWLLVLPSTAALALLGRRQLA